MSHAKQWVYGLTIGIVLGLGLLAMVEAQTAEGRFLRIWLNSACMLRQGSGTPESAVTGVICDLYLRTNGGAGTTLYIKESGTGNTGWIAPITEASAGTLTNKTLNVESTGNVVTITDFIDIPTAICSNAVAWSNWDLNTPATDSPNYVCVGGFSNGPVGYLEYGDGSNQYGYNRLKLPIDWTGAIDLTVAWFTSATTGNVRFGLQTACIAVGESLDAAWNTAQYVTDAAQGVTIRHNTLTFSSVTTTGCAAGEMFKFRLLREPGDAADTIAASAAVTEVTFTIRRAM